MAIMIESDEMASYTCPACGHIIKDRRGKKIECPVCDKEAAWIKKRLREENMKPVWRRK